MNKEKPNRPKSVFLSAISGNILEYYDFTVYAVFSVIIGKTFFPGEKEIIQVLWSLATFAVGFIMRPIGGIIFGYIGDKYGRRVSLITSMLGMTIPTFVIGLIPSYHDIGLWAPIVLVAMRLIQGLCISGEGAGAAIFILEHYQSFRPALTAGIVHGSNIAGSLIATIVGITLNRYYDTSFAWRFAFLLGGFMGLAGFYLRLRVSETPIFKRLSTRKKTSKLPFSDVLLTAKRSMFVTACLGGAASSIVYLVKSYINVFYNSVQSFDGTTSLIYSLYALFVMMLAMPLSGFIADLIGRFRVIVLSSIAIFVLSLPTLLLMASPIVWQQILALTILALLAGSISGTAYSFIIGLFTPGQRFSGVGFSYNLGIAIFGGTAAMISRWLVEATQLFYAPAFYIMLTSGGFLVIAYFMQDFIKETIEE